MPPQTHVAPPADFVDRVGVCLSALCMVHCLALPLLLLMTPAFLTAFLTGHEFHVVLAVLLTILAFASFWPGYRQHRRLSVFAAGLAGVCLISVGAFAEEWEAEALGRVLTVCGSVALIGAHVVNYVLRHRLDRHCHCPAEAS